MPRPSVSPQGDYMDTVDTASVLTANIFIDDCPDPGDSDAFEISAEWFPDGDVVVKTTPTWEHCPPVSTVWFTPQLPRTAYAS